MNKYRIIGTIGTLNFNKFFDYFFYKIDTHLFSEYFSSFFGIYNIHLIIYFDCFVTYDVIYNIFKKSNNLKLKFLS